MRLQLAVLLVPPLQSVFSTVSLDLYQWLTVLLLSMAPIPICEVGKARQKHRTRQKAAV